MPPGISQRQKIEEKMRTSEIDELLNQDCKKAISTLLSNGFSIFTETALSDCRELGVGMIHRTFRHEGRYDIVLCIKRLTKMKSKK